jgi:CobQ-like glutamine amidotransferase family enzyme
MKIEIVYGELANLLGEHGTQQLLAHTFGEDQLVRTRFPELPRFFLGDVDFVYMGPMPESVQRLVLERWREHGDAFEQAIQKGTVFFFSGNAMDLVGRSIRYVEYETMEGLGIFPFDTICRRYDRQNEVVDARFNEMPVMGFRSQFTSHTGDAGKYPFLEVLSGSGMNPDIATEGVRVRNFFGTSLLGPFLVLNPMFSKWLFRQFGFSGPLAFEEELLEAEAQRRLDFEESFGKKIKAPRLLRNYLKKEKEILDDVAKKK